MNGRGCRLITDPRIIFIVVILLFPAPNLAAADGIAFIRRPTSLDPLEVDEQRAFIAHKRGIQRMFIAITLGRPASTEDESRAAVWIFPVPGSPDRTDVEVAGFIPELTGEEFGRAFKRKLRQAVYYPMGSQPHFLLFSGLPGGSMAGAVRFAGTHPAVTTHKTIYRWGIQAELISADSTERLAEYLRKQNVGVKSASLKPFAPYLSDKYVLVVAWIRSYDELIKKFPQYAYEQGGRRPSLYVEFPTDKPFYPMRPTSEYGKNTIKVSLYLMGLFALDMSTWNASERRAVSPKVDYYLGDKQKLEDSYLPFLPGREKKGVGRGKPESIERFFEDVRADDLPFTRVVIKSPAEKFTQDLTFHPRSLARLMYSAVSAPWLLAPLAIGLLAVLSYFSAGISGKLVFGTWTPWARMGFWNCLTIAALVAATWVSRQYLDPETRTPTTSRGWESLVFCALACVPLSIMLSPYFRLDYPWPPEAFFHLIAFIFITALMTITARNLAAPGLAPMGKPHPDSEGGQTFSGLSIWQSVLRVTLACALAVVVFSSVFFMLLGEPDEFVLIFSLVGTGLLIPLSALIAVVLITKSWIVLRKVAASTIESNTGLRVARAFIAGIRPRPVILAILTSLVALVMLEAILFPSDSSTYGSMLQVGCYASITVILLVATWLLGKRTPASDSREVQVSPRPMAIAALLALLMISGFLTYIYVDRLDWVFLIFPPKNVRASDLSCVPAFCLTGVIAVIGFFNRSHLKRFRHGMSHKSGLAAILVILGVMSYFGVLPLFVIGFFTGPIDFLFVFALLSATWLVKNELQPAPTKALHFGAIFSIVFSLLNIAAFYGTRALLGYLGM